MRRSLLLIAVLLLHATGCRHLLYSMMDSVSGESGGTAGMPHNEFSDYADAYEKYEEQGAWPGRDY